jgi:hypothetical protein
MAGPVSLRRTMTLFALITVSYSSGPQEESTTWKE